MSNTPDLPLSIGAIKELLPHRYPFLLVDKITKFKAGEFIQGFKNVSINEPFFQGHFPDSPIMPGVLILEAMAQIGILFAKLTAPDDMENKLFVFAGMDKVRFRRPVLPGDQLIMDLKLLKRKAIIWKMEGVAAVDGEVAAEAVLMAGIQRKGSL